MMPCSFSCGPMVSRPLTDVKRRTVSVMARHDQERSKSSMRLTPTVSTRPAHLSFMQYQLVRTSLCLVPMYLMPLPRPHHQNRASMWAGQGISRMVGPTQASASNSPWLHYPRSLGYAGSSRVTPSLGKAHRRDPSRTWSYSYYPRAMSVLQHRCRQESYLQTPGQ